ncbi:MAG: hypothetical protein EA402_08485 [Planctomycetota bacterium]|nr:MAG: hypothetical protein EA402_08485 [Planctomycetota bacterium]
MDQMDLNALGAAGVLMFLVLWFLLQSLLVGIAAIVVGLPERSIGRALSAGAGVMVALILLLVFSPYTPHILLLPLGILLPSLVIQRIYESSIGRALLAYLVCLVFLLLLWLLLAGNLPEASASSLSTLLF